jgi:(p)ppGpp synthase/HD superfamily hydrolase
MTVKDIISLLHDKTPADIDLVSRAYKFAEKAHEGHKRNSGEPYFIHLFETAKTLADLGVSATVVSAGLLHDTIEDTATAPEEIENFGARNLAIFGHMPDDKNRNAVTLGKVHEARGTFAYLCD